MELLFSVLGGGLLEIGRCLCGCLYPKINSMFRFQSNLDNLRKEMECLRNLKDSVMEQIEAAEKDGHLVRPIVVEWFKKLENIEHEVKLLQASMTANGETLCNCCPSCSLRYRPALQVVKKLKEVKGLIEAGSFPSGLLIENSEVRKIERIPGPSTEGQSTPSKNLAKVLKLLDDDDVSKIGVWGMGGVGKTTLVKNLNNKLQNASLIQPFSVVIWATVSKQLDVRRVQTQIAERLNLGVKMGESVESTASQLYRRLGKEKRFLLILDDVWETIDLDYLGVPQPEDHKGCKLVFTSRSLDVCRQMKTDAEVKVDVLNEEESWQLFTQNAGKVSSLEHIEAFAKAVARECGGLPLAIIIVGASMRGKTMIELWKDALNALQRSVPHIQGIEDKVYKHLKWSYDSLAGGIYTKYCFLYCSLYPEDYSIEVRELVQSWLAEGLIDELGNYEDLFNRGIALVENLKDCCLLEHGVLEGTAKMHDVVRDVAIWIASYSEEECKSFVQSGIGLIDISEGELPESVKRVSFMDNKITRLPHRVMECPAASALLLKGNLSLEIIPEGFLLAFKALRVLNLSETGIQELPLSFLQLDELRALLLRGCHNLKELPPLGGFSRLQVLDCSNSGIMGFPQGMEELTNLRQLDLSHTHRFERMGPGIISQLSSLEVLDMTDSAYEWGGRITEQSIFYELGSLHRLSVLYIHLSISCPALGSLAWLERLKRFHIVIGQSDAKSLLPGKYDEKMLTLCGVDLYEVQFGWLLNNASSLVLDVCWGLELMHAYLGGNCYFSGLRSLTIMNYVCGANESSAWSSGAEFGHVPNLEELILDRVHNLETISDLLAILRLEFPKLRVIRVSNCHGLKYITSVGDSDLTFRNLEEVKVKFCDRLEELFSCSSSSQTPAPNPNVPKLRIVELNYLPELKTLFGPDGLWQHLEQIEVIKCDLLKKLPLRTQNAETIKEIRGEPPWWRQLEWDEEETKSSLQHCFTPICN